MNLDVSTPAIAVWVNAVLLFALLEALLLLGWRRWTGRGPAARRLWPSLVAGLALMGTVRLALEPVSGVWLLAGLTLAGLAHAVDVRRAWQDAAAHPPATPAAGRGPAA